MKQTFDIVVNPVVELVRGQINNVQGPGSERAVSAVVLIGGFGESEYLLKRLREAFQTDSLSVIQCPNA